MNKIKWLLGILLVTIAFGAGCTWFAGKNNNTENQGAGPKPAMLDGLSPAEAALRINFAVGSQIELRQSNIGDPKDAEEQSGGSKEGVRIVTIERFAPANFANINWKLSRMAETAASMDARESAAENPGTDVPDAEMEMQTVAGSIEGLNLSNAHTLYLPAYWPTDKINSGNTSGLWVSDDVFLELTKTHNSTIYYGIMDASLYGRMSASKAFTDQLGALRTQVTEAEKQDIEVDLVKSDTELADWNLLVNGKDVTVQVIKARNWYGEMVVLNNPQNPLILKMEFNPPAAGDMDNFSGDNLLKSLLGYEVTRLENVR